MINLKEKSLEAGLSLNRIGMRMDEETLARCKDDLIKVEKVIIDLIDYIREEEGQK